MRKLTPLQQRLLDAMTPGVWYKASGDGLPVATSRTYQALLHRGLIVSRREFPAYGKHLTVTWTHEFMRKEQANG